MVFTILSLCAGRFFPISGNKKNPSHSNLLLLGQENTFTCGATQLDAHRARSAYAITYRICSRSPFSVSHTPKFSPCFRSPSEVHSVFHFRHASTVRSSLSVKRKNLLTLHQRFNCCQLYTHYFDCQSFLQLFFYRTSARSRTSFSVFSQPKQASVMDFP